MTYYYTQRHNESNRQEQERRRKYEEVNRQEQEKSRKRELERIEARKKELDQWTLELHKEVTKWAINSFPKWKYNEDDIGLLIEIWQEKYSKSIFDIFETQFSNKMAQHLYHKASSRISNEEDPYLIDVSLREAKTYSQNKDIIIDLEKKYQWNLPNIWFKAAQKQVETWTDIEIIEIYINKAKAFPENKEKMETLDILYKKRLPVILLNNAAEFVNNYPKKSDRKEAEKLFVIAEAFEQNKAEIKTLRETFHKKRWVFLLKVLEFTIKEKDISGFNLILEELEKNHIKDLWVEINKLKAEALKIKK